MNNVNTADISDAIEQDALNETKEKRSIIKMITQFSTLSKMLRTIGAFSVVASMSVFLLQDWSGGNDLERYYILLSQSALLASGGFFLAFLLKENKSARVFFGLSIVSVAAILTTLGALIFSFVQWDNTLSTYPSIAHWTLGSGASIGVAIGLAAIVLIPITIFGFKVMARNSALPLTGAYLLTNSMLLLPVRDTLYTSIIAGASILLSLAFVAKLVAKDQKLRTAEGKFAIALLFVAPVIMLVRSLWLYQADELIYTIIAFTGYMTLRHCSLQLDFQSRLRKFMEFFSIPFAVLVATPAAQLIDKVLPVEFALPAFALVFTAHMIDLSKRSNTYKYGALYIYTLVTSISFMLHLAIVGTLFSGIICAVIGIAVMTMGYISKSRDITLLGFITTCVALIYDLFEIYAMIDLFSWSSLAVTGISAIVIASLIERHGVYIKLRFDKAFRTTETNV